MARPRKITTTKAPATAATHPQEQQELQAPTEALAMGAEQGQGWNNKPQPGEQPAAPLELLDDFLRRVEGAHIERDVVATAATHPQATETIWPGTYGGIRLSAGPVSVTYSDGTTE